VDCSLYAFNVCGEKPSILLSASYISHALDNNNFISPNNYLFTEIIDRIDEIETAVLIKLKKQFTKRISANTAHFLPCLRTAVTSILMIYHNHQQGGNHEQNRGIKTGIAGLDQSA